MNEQRRDALPPGARLDADKYEIDEVLGAGSFGLVYRVRHLLLDEERAIKEYLPSEIAVREGETVYARSGAHESDYRDGLQTRRQCARAVVRGGAWNNNPRNLRAANRNRNGPSNRNNNNGFWLVRAPRVPEWPRSRSRPA